MPERVQLSRARGWRLPPRTAKVDRSTRWGNPFVVSPDHDPGTVINDHGLIAMPSQAACVEAYRAWLGSTLEGQAVMSEARRKLAGLNLACWCKPGTPCHADVLLAEIDRLDRAAAANTQPLTPGGD